MKFSQKNVNADIYQIIKNKISRLFMTLDTNSIFVYSRLQIYMDGWIDRWTDISVPSRFLNDFINAAEVIQPKTLL